MMDLSEEKNVHKKIVASPYANFGLFGICKSGLAVNFTPSMLITKNENI